jgi:hypothetical protein
LIAVKVCRVLGSVFLAVSTVWYLQHYQPMVITSLLISLIPIAILSLQVFSLIVFLMLLVIFA